MFVVGQSELSLPADWEPTPDGQNPKVVELKQNSTEYRKVLLSFIGTLQQYKNDIEVTKVMEIGLCAPFFHVCLP